MIQPSREAFRRFTDDETFERIRSFGTFQEMWASCLSAYPEQTAIEDNGVRYTYAALEDEAAAFRTVLAAGGAPKKVAVFGPNSFALVKTLIGAVTLGCTAAVLPAQLPDMAVLGCCMKFGVEALIYDPALKDRVQLAAQKLPGLRLIASDETAAEKTAMRPVRPEDPCLIMFTGGTTGKSKGALLSHRAVMEGTVNGCYGIPEIFGQRYLLILPLSHVFGMIRNLFTSLYTGSDLFICRNNKDMFRDAAMFRPTVLVAVPAIAELALTLSKKFGRMMLGADLKTIICGAAPVAPYLIAEYHKLGVELYPGYGLTESANLVSGNPENLTRPTSVGLPYPNQELRIVDGELWIRGANMMDGYVGEDNAAAYSDAWFKTGDLARFDDDGFLYITGRIKEIILLPNGENVSPAEVEAHFNALPFVQDSQLFEDVNALGQPILALEIVPRATELGGMQDPQEEMTEALQAVNRSLPTWQQAAKITIRDKDFDRTPSMKIARYQKCK